MESWKTCLNLWVAEGGGIWLSDECPHAETERWKWKKNKIYESVSGERAKPARERSERTLNHSIVIKNNYFKKYVSVYGKEKIINL